MEYDNENEQAWVQGVLHEVSKLQLANDIEERHVWLVGRLQHFPHLPPDKRTLLLRKIVSQAQAAQGLERDGRYTMAESPVGKPASPPPLEAAAEVSAAAAERLAPIIGRIRQRVFGVTDQPFESVEEVVAWIKEQAAREPQDYVVHVVLDEDTATQFREELSSVGTRPPRPDEPAALKIIGAQGLPEQSCLRFVDEDGQTCTVGVSSQGGREWASQLAKLLHDSWALAEATGWHLAETMMYVLAGEPPTLPQARIRPDRRRWELEDGIFEYPHAQIDLFTFELSRQDIWSLYGQVRELLGVRHKNPTTRRRDERIRFVRDRESIMDECQDRTEFWQRLADEWAASKNLSPTKADSFQRTYKAACEEFGIRPIRYRHARRKAKPLRKTTK